MAYKNIFIRVIFIMLAFTLTACKEESDDKKDIDTDLPMITLIGADAILVGHQGSYVEQGVTITDNVDGDLSVTIEGAVDTNTVGNYILTYSVTDNAGNQAVNVIRTVSVIVDIEVPVITLIGDNPMTISLGSMYSEKGATVSDNVYGGLNVVITGSVDTNTLGRYTVNYNVTDAAGNIGYSDIRAFVRDTIAPTSISFTSTTYGTTSDTTPSWSWTTSSGANGYRRTLYRVLIRPIYYQVLV